MYNSNDVADRIRLLVKDKNMSMKQLLIDVDLGKNTMSNFKTSMPKADNLAKIADYLDCSVDYLLGRTDNPEINKPNNIIISKYSEQNVKLVADSTESTHINARKKKPRMTE